MFRSLFSWIMLGDYYVRVDTMQIGGQVSILVLLDHAGRRRATKFRRSNWGRFRSLFSWIMLGDTDAARCHRADTVVSILVLLDHAGRQPSTQENLEMPVMFRSLFSWIMLGDISFCVYCDAEWPGFDPCSPGSCWATRRDRMDRR